MAELRALSEYCNFGDTLESMLRDRLVCGVNELQIQKCLLAEDRLTFKKALEISLTLEAATKDTKQLQTVVSASSVPVHKVKETEGLSPNTKCYRCGKPNHKAPECRFKDSVCTKCNKKGHLAKVCYSRTPQKASGHSSQSRSNPVQTNTVISNTQVLEEYQLFSIQQAGIGSHIDPLTVSITINGKSIPMEIDTGSAVSIISESIYKNFFEAQTTETLQQMEAKLCTYSGEHLPVKGKLTCEVSYEGHSYTLPLIVLTGEGPTLLGRDWMQHIQLD